MPVSETTTFPSSSYISSAAWDQEARTLTLSFKSAQPALKFSGVGPEHYEGIQRSASPGKYYWHVLKDRYPAEPVA